MRWTADYALSSHKRNDETMTVNILTYIAFVQHDRRNRKEHVERWSCGRAPQKMI
jgi:hypothetical protein